VPERSGGKFDGSGVSGSTGRGRSQALGSKVRFADQPEVAQVLFQQRSVVSVDVRFLIVERSVHDHISLSEISKEVVR
jgi:hypothetical protein